MIVVVHSSKTSSPGNLSRYFFRSLWAESLMGVSGFFISWAILRATYFHANILCVFKRCVRSSSTATMPR